MKDKRVNRKWSTDKLSMAEVIARFNEAKMVVLDDDYIDSKTPINVECENGHKFSYPVYKLKTAKCCIYCRHEGRI